MTGTVKRAVGQIASHYGGSRSHRAVVRIVIFLTLVSMVIGNIATLPTGGSAIGDVIFVVVGTALVVVWLGIVLWALAAFWRVRICKGASRWDDEDAELRLLRDARPVSPGTTSVMS